MVSEGFVFGRKSGVVLDRTASYRVEDGRRSRRRFSGVCVYKEYIEETGRRRRKEGKRDGDGEEEDGGVKLKRERERRDGGVVREAERRPVGRSDGLDAYTGVVVCTVCWCF